MRFPHNNAHTVLQAPVAESQRIIENYVLLRSDNVFVLLATHYESMYDEKHVLCLRYGGDDVLTVQLPLGHCCRMNYNIN